MTNIIKCFIDTETTGLDFKESGLVEVAMIFDKNGQIINECTFNISTFPNDKIESEALQINGLTLEQIDSFPEPKTIHNEMLNLFQKHIDKYNKYDKMHFLAFNAYFDFQMMHSFFNKCNDIFLGSWFWFPPIDIMQIHAIKNMDARHKFARYNLESLCIVENIEWDSEQAHGAMYDIQKTRELYYKIIE